MKTLRILLKSIIPLFSVIIIFNYSFLFAMEEVEDDDIPVIKARINSKDTINVAVEGISYTLSPFHDPTRFLRCNRNGFVLSEQKTADSLFYFKLEENGKHKENVSLCSIINIGTKTKLGRDHKNLCLIVKERIILERRGALALHFKEGAEDKYPKVLTFSSENYVTYEDVNDAQYNKIWLLQPVYTFPSLTIDTIDRDTLCFKLPKKESISEQLLSKQQIQLLYQLHHQTSSAIPTIVGECLDYFLGTTSQTPFANQGIYVSSNDFPFRLHDIKGFLIGIGDSQLQARDAATKLYDSSEPFAIKSKHVVFIKMATNSVVLSPLGNVGLGLGKEGLTRYNGIEYDDPIPLKTILFNSNFHIGGKYLIRQDNNAFYITNGNQNAITHPGTTILGMHMLVRQSTKDFEASGLKIFSPLAQSLENFGKSVEAASKNTQVALTDASRELSTALKYSINNLSSTVNFASTTFENALKLLALEINNVSKETTKNVKLTLTSLENTSKILSAALTESSGHLGEGARSVAKALKESAEHFENAFGQVSKALRGSAADIKQATETASENFLQGMEKLRQAAQSMSSIDVDVGICSIQ